MLAVYRRDAENAEMELNKITEEDSVSSTITRKTLRPLRLSGET